MRTLISAVVFFSMILASNSAFAVEHIRIGQSFQPVISLKNANGRVETGKRLKRDLQKHVDQDLKLLTANRKTILSKPTQG